MKKYVLMILILLFISILSYAQVSRATVSGGTADLSSYILAANDTINLDTGMSADSINAIITAQPKDLGGYSLVYQFADGTYNLSNRLLFSYYYNGTLNIQGNSGDASLATGKAVILNFNNATSGILLDQITAETYLRRLEVNIGDVAGGFCVKAEFCYNLSIDNIYIETANNTANATGTYFIGTNARVRGNSYGIVTWAILAGFNSYISSEGNDDNVASQPLVGINATYNSVVGKIGTQVTGSSVNESTDNAGIIR